MVSHWSLSGNKSPYVSRTILSILANLYNAEVWMVSTRPLISKSSSTCINHLVTVPRGPITNGITVTFMFLSFFNVLIPLFAFFQFYSVVVGRDSKIHNSASWLLLGLIVRPRLRDRLVSQKPRGVCASHSPGQTLGWAYTILLSFITLLEFFTSVLTDGFSLEFEW